MKNTHLIIWFMLAVLGAVPATSKLRVSTALNIPTSDMLTNKQFSLSLKNNFFAYSPTDTSGNMKIWYMPVVEAGVGIKNRVELGVGYSGGPTLNFKALLLDEEKETNLPSVAIGAKDIMKSSEAYMYGMTNVDTVDAMANLAFVALGKSFDQFGTRLHLGAMSNFSIRSERFSFFGGAEVYLGSGFYLTYEGFRRFGSFHQFFTITWMYKKKFLASAGLSELRQAFQNDGKFGLFLFSDKYSHSNGYGTPGCRVSLMFTGTPSGDASGIRGLEDEISELKKSLDEFKKTKSETDVKLDNVEKQLTGLEEDFTAMTTRGSPDRQKDYKTSIAEEIRAISDLIENGKGSYDAEIVSVHAKKIIEFKEFALPALSSIIRNPASNPVLSSLAIQMIGEIGNKKSKQMLLRLLDYKESDIKIDALIALGKLRDKGVAKDLEGLLQDTDGAVAMAAQEVIYKLTGVKRAIASKGAPADSTAGVKKTERVPAAVDDTLAEVPEEQNAGLDEKPAETNSDSIATPSEPENAPAAAPAAAPTTPAPIKKSPTPPRQKR